VDVDATAGLHAVSWVRIDPVGGCRVYGCTRLPVSRRITLHAALRMAAAGVPAVLVGEAA
jgi:hypothetical protein